MDSLLADLARLRGKQSNNTNSILSLVDLVQGTIAEMGESSVSNEGRSSLHSSAQTNITSTSEKKHNSKESGIDGVMSSLADQYKVYHTTMSKFIKSADRVFNEGPPDVSFKPNLPFDRKLFDEMVALHLYRQGKFQTAANLVQEAGLSLNLQSYESLIEVYKVIEQMKEKKDLSGALAWVQAHQERLKLVGSNVDFQLARLEYLTLLSEFEAEDSKLTEEERKVFTQKAVDFARSRFSDFLRQQQPQHLEQVQSLVGCLAYIGRLHTSPYQELLSESLWEEVRQTFYHDACQALGLPKESPLSQTYRAGVQALPALEKMKAIVVSSKGDWDRLSELPGEIDVGGSLRFHSIFSCPVTREQASKDNPPMMLKCGHVICRNSMARLLRGGSRRLKCPTCPLEQFAEDAQQLFL